MLRFLMFLIFAAATAIGAHAQEHSIGYLSLESDPRYEEEFVYARIELAPRGDAVIGARMAVEDMKMLAEARGLTFSLVERKVPSAELEAAAREMAEDGAAYIVIDLPADEVDRLAGALADVPVVLLNATAHEDALRRRCHANLLHVAASHRMIGDAMAQFLRTQNWNRVLMLVGKEPGDPLVAEAFAESARRLQLQIVETKPFDLSTAPEQREQNNIKLLTTTNRDYDVVYIADTRGEFGRYLPYQTQLPRPVVGSTGLVATEWHWSLERYGAPQVNSRFETMADGRRMVAQDWATWAAVRAVITAYSKTRDTSPEGVQQFLLSDRLRLDGSKGVPMTFRPWDKQMRMPILMATHNAVVAIAPFEGFLHQANTLDTLGTDEPEFRCD